MVFYVSSSITYLYKKVIPSIYFLVVSLFWISLYTIIPEKYFDGMLILGFIFLFSLLALVPLIRLKKVYYDNDYTYISNYSTTIKVKHEELVSIKRYIFYFYKLSYRKNESIYSVIFITSLYEKMGVSLCVPKSIIKFKKVCGL